MIRARAGDRAACFRDDEATTARRVFTSTISRRRSRVVDA
jgi:hypothetical protein